MYPSVACTTARRVLTTVLVAVSFHAAASSAQSTSPKRGTSTASAYPKQGAETPLPETPMPLVAPVFLQTDQIDSSITVVNSIIFAVNGTVTLRDQQGNVLGHQTISFPAHSTTPVQ